MVKLIYFAAVREAMGIDAEQVALPADVVCVRDLTRWLINRNQQLATHTVNVAIDKKIANGDDKLAGVNEIAIFPPMTGG